MLATGFGLQKDAGLSALEGTSNDMTGTEYPLNARMNDSGEVIQLTLYLSPERYGRCGGGILRYLKGYLGSARSGPD